MTQERYCLEKLDARHSLGVNGLKPFKREITNLICELIGSSGSSQVLKLYGTSRHFTKYVSLDCLLALDYRIKSHIFNLGMISSITSNRLTSPVRY